MLTGTIVTYKNDFEKLSHAISSFLQTDLEVHLFIFDNSPSNKIRSLCSDSRITYHYNNGENIGFGKGHNFIIKHYIQSTNFHLVMNPDIFFEKGVLEKLCNFMKKNSEAGLVMPKILNPDGSLQYNCKLLPSPKDLILRRFLYPFKNKLAKSNFQYEMQFADYNQQMEVPYLSGCFMFFNMKALNDVGLFDESFFLYAEDVDLSRRIHQRYKTMYLPEAKIYHYHEKGSYKSLRLLWYNIISAIKYFNKWGWNDEERKMINEKTMLILQ